MRNSWRGIALAMLLLYSGQIMATRPQIKFGEVKPKDFENTVYSIDSNASAIVIADIGSCKYEGNNLGSFDIVYKRHLRIHLLNRNGFDAANISIPLYVSSSVEDNVDKMEAYTFNMEGGKVQQTKLDKGSIFKDKLSKYFNVRKFTMPNIKEGSIIDIQYTISSPYPTYMRPWDFQGSYPVLWSEYETSVPSIFDFVTITQGYHPFVVKDSRSSTENYMVRVPGSAGERSEMVNVPNLTEYRKWAMENLPALKSESFTSTLNNHIAKLEFQLARLKFPGANIREVMTTWTEASKNLMKDPDFGEELTKGLGWLKDDNKKITEGTATSLEAARKIYAFVRDNFTCTNHHSKYKSASLKKTLDSKSGNVADINILLTAMLKAQGFEANPVMLSTRPHGKAYEIYPVMDKFDYVICRVVIDEKPYLLDASYNKLGFGKLASDSYNGYARIISENPVLLNLQPEELNETKITTLFLLNDEKSGLAGTYKSILGENESFRIRDAVVKGGKEAYFKELKKEYTQEIDMKEAQIDSLKYYEEPVQVSYKFHLDTDEDIIYFNPLMSSAMKKNPLTSAKRLYPVEMPYAFNDVFILRMDVPKGYTVDEAPKSTRVKFNENEGMFEYLVSVKDNIIQLRSKLELKKATYSQEEYDELRNFFAFVVKKQAEQIVFKKIK
jgi:hypothetical protein